ncbi:hypothetical protein SISNIDRAFT_250014 [Sistotremastrum niveocremeum HHB9708]|uniref:Uncharacterized protein n=1 Tax=Sistotremastrum niveocremeum HHB9708 TaxID=1314777 RepID=A0A164YWR4_9AGAM|nr:hypothetical protein SISNIDRAFT_250014 [Sistotremastrum niveocremeum HHB9708]
MRTCNDGSRQVTNSPLHIPLSAFRLISFPRMCCSSNLGCLQLMQRIVSGIQIAGDYRNLMPRYFTIFSLLPFQLIMIQMRKKILEEKILDNSGTLLKDLGITGEHTELDRRLQKVNIVCVRSPNFPTSHAQYNSLLSGTIRAEIEDMYAFRDLCQLFCFHFGCFARDRDKRWIIGRVANELRRR